MPIYDYACKNCDHQFTETYKIVDRDKPTKIKCSECGKKKITQLLNSPMIVDPVRLGIIKPSSQFTDVLTQIHESTPGSKLGQKLQGSRPENTGAKDIPTQKAARKYISKLKKGDKK